MDARVNQLARELSDAVAAAVANDPRVAACREKAGAEGFDLRLSLDAVIQVVNRSGEPTGRGGPAESRRLVRQFEMSANDRRFLKSLRISADEPTEKVD